MELDPTVPPFSKANIPSEVTLLVHLDRARPLSEPKWVKSGDVQEWLRSMFGRMIWLAGDVAGGWENKIEVVDPDPVSFYLCYRSGKLSLLTKPYAGATTIWSVLDGWAANSTVGLQTGAPTIRTYPHGRDG